MVSHMLLFLGSDLFFFCYVHYLLFGVDSCLFFFIAVPVLFPPFGLLVFSNAQQLIVFVSEYPKTA